jgi:hypothetical protein
MGSNKKSGIEIALVNEVEVLKALHKFGKNRTSYFLIVSLNFASQSVRPVV